MPWGQAGDQVRSLPFSAATAHRVLDSMQTLRWVDAGPGFSVLRTIYAGRTGVCGNGVCEVCLAVHAWLTDLQPSGV